MRTEREFMQIKINFIINIIKLYPTLGCKEKNKEGLKFQQSCIDLFSEYILND